MFCIENYSFAKNNLCFAKKIQFLLSKTNDFQPWGLPEITKFAAQNADVKQSAMKLEI